MAAIDNAAEHRRSRSTTVEILWPPLTYWLSAFFKKSTTVEILWPPLTRPSRPVLMIYNSRNFMAAIDLAVTIHATRSTTVEILWPPLTTTTPKPKPIYNSRNFMAAIDDLVNTQPPNLQQ